MHPIWHRSCVDGMQRGQKLVVDKSPMGRYSVNGCATGRGERLSVYDNKESPFTLTFQDDLGSLRHWIYDAR